MALLNRFSKLTDRGETGIFTFIVTKSVTRDVHRDATTKDFCFGYHRWAISFQRPSEKMLGVHLLLRNANPGTACVVDFTLTLLNREHFSQNQVYSKKQAKFTITNPMQGVSRWIELSELVERRFSNETGEFLFELSLSNMTTIFECDINLTHTQLAQYKRWLKEGSTMATPASSSSSTAAAASTQSDIHATNTSSSSSSSSLKSDNKNKFINQQPTSGAQKAQSIELKSASFNFGAFEWFLTIVPLVVASPSPPQASPSPAAAQASASATTPNLAHLEPVCRVYLNRNNGFDSLCRVKYRVILGHHQQNHHHNHHHNSQQQQQQKLHKNKLCEFVDSKQLDQISDYGGRIRGYQFRHSNILRLATYRSSAGASSASTAFSNHSISVPRNHSHGLGGHHSPAGRHQQQQHQQQPQNQPTTSHREQSMVDLRVHIEMYCANTISEAKVPMQRKANEQQVANCTDRNKQAWCIESDEESGDTLKLKLFFMDLQSVPRNHIRYISWIAYLVRRDPKSGQMRDSVAVKNAPHSTYYLQDGMDMGTIMDTDIQVKELNKSPQSYLSDGNQLTVHIEWVDSLLLFSHLYNNYDALATIQRHQISRELEAVQFELEYLERKYAQVSRQLASFQGTADSAGPSAVNNAANSEERHQQQQQQQQQPTPTGTNSMTPHSKGQLQLAQVTRSAAALVSDADPSGQGRLGGPGGGRFVLAPTSGHSSASPPCDGDDASTPTTPSDETDFQMQAAAAGNLSQRSSSQIGHHQHQHHHHQVNLNLDQLQQRNSQNGSGRSASSTAGPAISDSSEQLLLLVEDAGSQSAALYHGSRPSSWSLPGGAGQLPAGAPATSSLALGTGRRKLPREPVLAATTTMARHLAANPSFLAGQPWQRSLTPTNEAHLEPLRRTSDGTPPAGATRRAFNSAGQALEQFLNLQQQQQQDSHHLHQQQQQQTLANSDGQLLNHANFYRFHGTNTSPTTTAATTVTTTTTTTTTTSTPRSSLGSAETSAALILASGGGGTFSGGSLHEEEEPPPHQAHRGTSLEAQRLITPGGGERAATPNYYHHSHSHSYHHNHQLLNQHLNHHRDAETEMSFQKDQDQHSLSRHSETIVAQEEDQHRALVLAEADARLETTASDDDEPARLYAGAEQRVPLELSAGAHYGPQAAKPISSPNHHRHRVSEQRRSMSGGGGAALGGLPQAGLFGGATTAEAGAPSGRRLSPLLDRLSLDYQPATGAALLAANISNGSSTTTIKTPSPTLTPTPAAAGGHLFVGQQTANTGEAHHHQLQLQLQLQLQHHHHHPHSVSATNLDHWQPPPIRHRARIDSRSSIDDFHHQDHLLARAASQHEHNNKQLPFEVHQNQTGQQMMGLSRFAPHQSPSLTQHHHLHHHQQQPRGSTAAALDYLNNPFENDDGGGGGQAGPNGGANY